MRRHGFLKEVIVKLERADAHMEVLESDVQRSLRRMVGYRMVDKSEPNGVKKRLWFEPRDPRIQLNWGLAFGDAIHNLRSALDYLIWGLTVRNGYTPPPNPIPVGSEWTKLEFPLYARPRKKTDPWSEDPPRGLWGIADQPALLDFIESKQPYQTGDSALILGLLRELSNINKHRTISLLGVRTNALLTASDPSIGDTYRIEGSSPNDPQAEMTVPHDAGAEGVEVNFQVSIELSLDSGEPAEFQSPESLYVSMRDQVTGVVDFIAANLPPPRGTQRLIK